MNEKGRSLKEEQEYRISREAERSEFSHSSNFLLESPYHISCPQMPSVEQVFFPRKEVHLYF